MIVVHFHNDKEPEIVFEGSEHEVASWLSPYAVERGCYYEHDKPDNVRIDTRTYSYYRKYESEAAFKEWMQLLIDG